MSWSLYDKNGFLKPLIFSNGKTQEDIVKEVKELIDKGNKIIFIHGICGTGKSGIALNLAREIGKTSIVVPIKNLQEQYKKDYEKDKYVLKKNKKKLKISIITGRNNHKCKFLEDKKNLIPKVKREINAKLYDIFEKDKKEIEKDVSADNPNIPCKIEIKEKNWNKLKQYLKQNKRINIKDFKSIKDVKRASIASVCPYWSPALPKKYELKLGNITKKEFKALNGVFIYHQRKPGCSFYEQFDSYSNSDVIVFNSLKYKIETEMGRKPKTKIEIIDECDEFLDSFANQKNLNLSYLESSLIYLASNDREIELLIKELLRIIKQIKLSAKTKELLEKKKIVSLKETGIYDLFAILIKNGELIYEIDEENYLFDALKIAKSFEGLFLETYLSFHKKDNNIISSIVTINLEKKFKEIINKNKTLVLMSGTLHSQKVLNEIFGLKDFKIVEAETQNQGQIKIQKTGLEINCRYSNFSCGNYTREDYLKSLDKCIEQAKKPAIVHVNAFGDLPSKDEINKFKLKNLIDKEKLIRKQKEDKKGEIIDKFKRGEIKILFSTKISRGIDFPGNQCNSIIFTKYPNPNVKDIFWKILHQTKPRHYWDFYKDKAQRELLQKVYRGLRFKDDKVYVLSPDSRVIDFFENNF